MILHTAGVLALERDDCAAAEAHFAEALGDTDHVSDAAHLGAAGPALWGLAVSAARGGRFERALRLFAAVERYDVSAALVLPPWFRARVEEAAATALRALPKARAEGALAAGRRLGSTTDRALRTGRTARQPHPMVTTRSARANGK